MLRTYRPFGPKNINRSWRGDLETIVGKALEKDKSQRYASAAELAADLRRYLRDEPITAQPPSTTYQLRKFAKRNAALVWATLAVFVALATGAAFTTWQSLRATRALAVAESNQQRAITEANKFKAMNEFLQAQLLE